MPSLTPMMQQYVNIKNEYKDTILFFRLGDFYEMFFEDALITSKELEIVLTERECGLDKKAPMCGIPYHAADSYIKKLVDRGYKVAICEQLEDPAVAKGIVKRDVTRIITPGTITDINALNEKENNFLCSVYLNNNEAGLAFVDVSTGELYTTQYLEKNNKLKNFIINEIAKYEPSELICNKALFQVNNCINIIENKIGTYINQYDNFSIDINECEKYIFNQLKTKTLKNNNIYEKNSSIIATGNLIKYLNETQKIELNHINKINYYYSNNYMILDYNTRINLELNETILKKEKKGSLLWLLDSTSTAMGSRLLKKWLEQPLIDANEINKRFDIVEILKDNIILLDDIRKQLMKVYDIERIMGKIAYGNCNARDLISLKKSLESLPILKSLLVNSNYKILRNFGNNLDCLNDIFDLINMSIEEEPPISIKEGGIIKSNFNNELKELKEASIKGKEWLSKLEEKEKEKTGIKFLKIGYNKVFGYYIEVSKSNLKYVPDYYIRKQTLANSERFITPELKEMENKILNAEEKMIQLEYSIFINIRNKIKKEIERIQKTSRDISKIDVLSSFAYVSYKNNYSRPKINDKGIIKIKNGRHPVVEKMLKDHLFVPNDTYLDNDDNRVCIITGPNMAGKSTYMRQIALITIMAQIGCFVPADEASIGIVDRIFTRIGASDNLSEGESTFMVEMNEVANIINNATKNSLLILDEVGRGTSTYDGLSIAWAVIEYIADKEKIGAKTLFATHYHELTSLEGKINGIKNYNILVKEQDDEIIFLRKIAPGCANRSYGIEVAKLAGINIKIIKRANEILAKIENDNLTNVNNNIETKNNKNIQQINMFDCRKDELIDNIKKINIMETTPIEAINILNKIIEQAKKL